jgi:predicted Zn finger-like uncharacterized protein
MAIQIACPSCAAQLHLPENLLGSEVRCPTCQTIFMAQAPPPPSAPPGSVDAAVQTGPSAPSAPTRRPEYEDRAYDEDYHQRYYGGHYVPARGGIWLGLGIASLAALPLGICLQPFVFGCISLGLGLTAMLMGSRDLKRIRKGEMDPQGEGLTKAGWVCGIIGTILGGLMTLCGGAALLFILVMLATGNLK